MIFTFLARSLLMCLTCGLKLPRSFAFAMFAMFLIYFYFVLLTVPAKILYLHLANSIVFNLLFHFLMSKLSSNISLFSKIMSYAKSVSIIFIL